MFAFIGRVNPKGCRKKKGQNCYDRANASQNLKFIALSTVIRIQPTWLSSIVAWPTTDDWKKMKRFCRQGWWLKKQQQHCNAMSDVSFIISLVLYSKNVWKRHIKRAVIEQFRSFLLLKYIALSLFITMNIYLWCKDSGPRPPLFQPPEREWWREIKVITGFFQTCGKKGVIWLMWNALRCSLRNPWRKNTEEQFQISLIQYSKYTW